MTTLVYRYGLAAPHENSDLVEAQMRAAHEYRCALVRIERQRRGEERAARSGASAELRECEEHVRLRDAECARLAGEILAARKAARKRAETAEARDALGAARLLLREAKGRLFALREQQRAQCAECRKAKSEIVPCEHAHEQGRALRLVLDEIDLRTREKIRGAYGASPCYWGTKLVVDKAMGASRAAPLYERDGLTPHDPPFPRWDGGGCVAVQFQAGLSALSALGGGGSGIDRASRGGDDRLCITQPPWPEQWQAERAAPTDVGTPGRRPAGRRPDGTPAPATRADGTPARWVRDRAARHGQLSMCVATEGRGKPLWAAWRLDYDRPLPAGARITWAHVYRRMRGPHAEWSLCVTVELPAPEAAETRKHGTVAVDLGWRLMPCSGGSKCHAERDDCRELRVAGWCDDAGRSGELRLSATDLRALRGASQIRSERDLTFDRIKAEVATWIRAARDAPEWMRELAAHMHSWRRQGRMVTLLKRWTEERTERPRPKSWSISQSSRGRKPTGTCGRPSAPGTCGPIAEGVRSTACSRRDWLTPTARSCWSGSICATWPSGPWSAKMQPRTRWRAATASSRR